MDGMDGASDPYDLKCHLCGHRGATHQYDPDGVICAACPEGLCQDADIGWLPARVLAEPMRVYGEPGPVRTSVPARPPA